MKMIEIVQTYMYMLFNRVINAILVLWFKKHVVVVVVKWCVRSMVECVDISIYILL